MEKKVQIALCALLFINLGSIVRGLESTPPPVPSESTNSEKSDPNTGQPPSSSGSEAAGSMPGITLGDSLKPQANTSISSSESNNASSSGNNSNTEAEPASLTPTIPGHSDHYSSTSSPPNTLNGNVTITSATMDMDLPEIPSFPGNNTSFTEQSQPHTTLAPSENPNATTTHISHSSTTITHTVLPASKQTHITTPPPTTAPHLASSHTPTHQTSASSHATHSVAHHPKTTIPTSAPTTESPDKLHPNIEADVTTAIRIQSSSTSSTHQETPVAPVTSLPTPQSDSHPEIPSPTHPKSTISTPSSSSGQAKPHVDSPSQLNMGGAATVVHESATPDPLLAGLVSAFIITAVIITLLLFLKLRRRDNRPEFRRLQDLPMDDMMEDTPLSMYSY